MKLELLDPCFLVSEQVKASQPTYPAVTGHVVDAQFCAEGIAIVRNELPANVVGRSNHVLQVVRLTVVIARDGCDRQVIIQTPDQFRGKGQNIPIRVKIDIGVLCGNFCPERIAAGGEPGFSVRSRVAGRWGSRRVAVGLPEL